mmetsp:Transcript_8257/g.20288  ORF Transcript_8257/g.20288 Transcript_8257/m.20288 type:complete len:371 (-) Transcript_8257:405-1517(-)|eukprot:CAMPEP_0114509744 /NCGR_PEP_ID=MMETSP0109-20121206/13385_1 /TAXON_ID=29199 /ORGANISM="Chlorarachnion reptans, Strain CCCM449" /LENGTH=370 /DNA_ID=CAMNT_0001688941 /DNA_START=89 /DNA_END=1201 /DNA_ORIENTATION=-
MPTGSKSSRKHWLSESSTDAPPVKKKAKKSGNLLEEIQKNAYIRMVKIEEVTKENVQIVHSELKQGNTFQQLTNGRVPEAMVFDFLSFVHGTYLEGASLVENQVPFDDDYDIKNPNALFVWRDLRIFIIRRDNKSKPIVGIVVLHTAYLTSLPGTEEHHDEEPVMIADGKDVAEEIGYEGEGHWIDIPVLSWITGGVEGYGDLLLGLCMVNNKNMNFIVHVGGGKANEPVIQLAKRWQFKKLRCKHPQTLAEWKDADGYDAVVKFRKKGVTVRRCAGIFNDLPLPKQLQERRERKLLQTKNKGVDKQVLEKIKASHARDMKKKIDEISKAKAILKKKEVEIQKLRKHIQARLSNSTLKTKLLKMIRKGLN